MPPTILLIGGHGKVAQLLTPLLLARAWNVTSMIRASEQQAAIEKLGQGQPGQLRVLLKSVEEVRTEEDANRVLEQVRPDWVVWSAGKSFSCFVLCCFGGRLCAFYVLEDLEAIKEGAF